MISAKYRFKGNRSIEFVYRNGKAFRVEALTMKAVKTNRKNYRLTVVVSKKINKSAVVRNRIRRRIYEQFRLLMAQKPNLLPYDMVVTVFDEQVAEISAKKIADYCQQLLQKAENSLK